MKRTFLNLKTLLVAVGLCAGGSAWAQTTAFSQDFTAVGESTVSADYGFTMTTYNNGAATVTGGLLQYSLPANKDKDVSAWGVASFTAIPTGNVVTVSCSWNPGGPTGTRPYSTLRVYGNNGTEDKVVFSLYNDGQAKTLRLASYDSGTLLASGDNWRSSSVVWNVVAVLNISTQKVVSLTVTKSGESTPVVSQENIVFENEVVNINKFEFGTNKKSSYSVTSTLDNVLITYESAAAVADVTFKYEDTDGNDLSAMKADVIESDEVGATVADIITNPLKASFYNGDESVRYDYSSYTCSDETVPAGGTTVTLKFAPKAKYTYNVYAVDGSSTQLATIATATAYAGDESNLIWSKYVKVGEQWYVTSETTFATTVTSSGSRNVVYSTSDVAYFFEMESLTRSGGAYLTEEATSYSGKSRLRISKGSMHYTPALSAGVYTLNIGVANGNSSSSDVYVYTRSDGGVLSDSYYTHTATSGSTTLNTVIVIPEGYSIVFKGNEGSSNNNARMDYMTLTPATVSISVSAAGYATFSSTYALDLSNISGGTAYVVTGTSGDYITLEAASGVVPANTGLIVKSAGGAAGTVTIPLSAADGTAPTTNYLVAVTADNTSIEAGNYVLGAVSNTPGFYVVDETVPTLDAGKAYLTLPTSSTKARLLFPDDATGISAISANDDTMESGILYNLAGQQVTPSYKGIVIKNGKKFIIK